MTNNKISVLVACLMAFSNSNLAYSSDAFGRQDDCVIPGSPCMMQKVRDSELELQTRLKAIRDVEKATEKKSMQTQLELERLKKNYYANKKSPEDYANIIQASLPHDGVTLDLSQAESLYFGGGEITNNISNEFIRGVAEHAENLLVMKVDDGRSLANSLVSFSDFIIPDPDSRAGNISFSNCSLLMPSYGINLSNTKLFCDDKSRIFIIKNDEKEYQFKIEYKSNLDGKTMTSYLIILNNGYVYIASEPKARDELEGDWCGTF